MREEEVLDGTRDYIHKDDSTHVTIQVDWPLALSAGIFRFLYPVIAHISLRTFTSLRDHE